MPRFALAVLATATVPRLTASSIRGAYDRDYEAASLSYIAELSSSAGAPSFACATAAFDASSCSSAKVGTEQNGCVWCEYPQKNFGLCLAPDQGASIAGIFPAVKCGAKKEDEEAGRVESVALSQADVGDGIDYQAALTCLLNGMDEETCTKKPESAAASCSWCQAGDSGFGVCVTTDMATKYGGQIPQAKCAHPPKTFGEILEEEEMRWDQEEAAVGEDPDMSDTKCIQSKADHETCHTQTDAKSNACIWCNAAGLMGLCVSQPQSELVGKFGLGDFVECEGGKQPAPDSLCVKSHAKTGEECGKVVDANKEACQWCNAMGIIGTCVNKKQAEMAGKFPGGVVKCGAEADDVEDADGTMDTKCATSGATELTCPKARDSNGNSCVWCGVPGLPSGACVSKDQAGLASNTMGGFVKCGGSSQQAATAQERDLF